MFMVSVKIVGFIFIFCYNYCNECEFMIFFCAGAALDTFILLSYWAGAGLIREIDNELMGQ
jgi:hypothetical protein